jgi:hypothetical protein
MSEPLVLTIPEDIAEDARNTAKTLGRDAAEMLIEHLAAREFRKPAIFPNEVEEQALMQQLSDGAVWAIAREHMGKKVAQRMRSLMRKNSLGKISPQEHQELETLVEAGQITSAPDPLTGKVVPLFNSRIQNWDDHFYWSENAMVILGKTAVGRATIERLKMNQRRQILARAIWHKAGAHPPNPR